ncbi:hypothetical protein ACVWWO_000956 [Bradyrhizobium sp. F1.13.1]
MSQPPAYTPVHSFISDSATLANFPGQALDVEFSNVKATTDQIRTNLALIQRDDGALANSSVTYDQLSPALQTNGIAPASQWVTGVLYSVGTAVLQLGALYRCAVAHTAGTFAADLSAGKWTFVIALPGASLPLPTTITPGGVKAVVATSHQFVTGLGVDGALTRAQPSAADVSGLVASATTDTTDAANISRGTLSQARLPLSLPGSTVVGNLTFWNDTTGTSFGVSPTYQSGNPANSALYAAVPDPTTGYTGIYNALQVGQGVALPAAQQYLGGAVVVRQGVVGTSVIPSTDTTTWQAAGVAGYAHGNVAGAGRNLVGVYGQATTSVANGNLFGGNTLATNSDGTTSNIGFDANYITAFEFNINLWKKAGSVDPVIAGGHVYGITIAGSGNIASQIAGSAGIVLNQMCVGTNIPWNYAIQTYDGAATVGVQLGANGTGNNVNGQSYRSTGRDAGGTAHTIDMHGDPNGALILAPG